MRRIVFVLVICLLFNFFLLRFLMLRFDMDYFLSGFSKFCKSELLKICESNRKKWGFLRMGWRWLDLYISKLRRVLVCWMLKMMVERMLSIGRLCLMLLVIYYIVGIKEVIELLLVYFVMYIVLFYFWNWNWKI